MTADELGSVMSTLVLEAVGPVRTSMLVLDDRIKGLQGAAASVERVAGELASLRERVAVLETRAPVPGPAGDPGRDGLDGRDGADGCGLEDFTAEYDGERTITLAFARPGRERKAFPLTLPFQKYQGVYQAGRTYVEGDTVTAAGSVWHCRIPTNARRPGDGETGWTLAVKSGERVIERQRGDHA